MAISRRQVCNLIKMNDCLAHACHLHYQPVRIGFFLCLSLSISRLKPQALAAGHPDTDTPSEQHPPDTSHQTPDTRHLHYQPDTI